MTNLSKSITSMGSVNQMGFDFLCCWQLVITWISEVQPKDFMFVQLLTVITSITELSWKDIH